MTAISQGQAISCKYITKAFKQISGSNKFRTHWRDASNEWGRVQNSARGSIKAVEVHEDDDRKAGQEGKGNPSGLAAVPRLMALCSAEVLRWPVEWSVAIWLKFWLLLGRRPPVLFYPMDNILRNLENLSRTELVWLNTYLAGRLRALPPENELQPPVPKAAPNESATMPEPTEVVGQHGATVAPLPERIDAFNYSLDPWERTGARHKVGRHTFIRQWEPPLTPSVNPGEHNVPSKGASLSPLRY